MNKPSWEASANVMGLCQYLRSLIPEFLFHFQFPPQTAQLLTGHASHMGTNVSVFRKFAYENGSIWSHHPGEPTALAVSSGNR